MAHAQAQNELMSTEELLQSQVELYHHSLALVKSMALRTATDLRIPEAIHRRGGAATLSDLAAETGIHSTKVSHLRRVMRVLTISGVFSVQDSDGDAVYKLTGVSRLLAGGGESSCDLSPVVRALVDPVAVAALFSVGEWFTDKRASAMSLFEVAHGCTRWEMTAKSAVDNIALNAAVAADSRFIMEALLRKGSSHFEGLSSLVDVGGGHGAVAADVAKAFPHVKCTVLDLPHVIAGAPAGGSVQFVAGDFFEHIPPADAVLLKLILHCWQDDDAVRILRRCKEAIPARDAGGKVIIIDVVLGSASTGRSQELEVLFDVFNMHLDGGEREEHRWSKIFFDAGFSDYKITSALGFRSIIEVYP